VHQKRTQPGPRGLRRPSLDDGSIPPTTCTRSRPTSMTSGAEQDEVSREGAERAKKRTCSRWPALGSRTGRRRAPEVHESKFRGQARDMKANIAAFPGRLELGETLRPSRFSTMVKPTTRERAYRNITRPHRAGVRPDAALQAVGLPISSGSYPIPPATTSCTNCPSTSRFGVRRSRPRDENRGRRARAWCHLRRARPGVTSILGLPAMGR